MPADRSKYEEQVEKLFTNAREKRFPKNQIICYQGDTLTAIYQIKEGYVKAYTILDSGDTRTIFILGPGDIFPIAFSLTLDWDEYQLRYFYQSLTDVKVVQIEQVPFKQLISDEPRMSEAYMWYMGASNDGLMKQLEAMKHKTAKNKILVLLPYLVSKVATETAPNTYRLNLKLSHQELADLSGITRETTTALIKELESDGVIKQQRDTWIVKLEPEDGANLIG